MMQKQPRPGGVQGRGDELAHGCDRRSGGRRRGGRPTSPTRWPYGRPSRLMPFLPARARTPPVTRAGRAGGRQPAPRQPAGRGPHPVFPVRGGSSEGDPHQADSSADLLISIWITLLLPSTTRSRGRTSTPFDRRVRELPEQRVGSHVDNRVKGARPAWFVPETGSPTIHCGLDVPFTSIRYESLMNTLWSHVNHRSIGRRRSGTPRPWLTSRRG